VKGEGGGNIGMKESLSLNMNKIGEHLKHWEKEHMVKISNPQSVAADF
jgi:hypothetical protein